jgi:hypothetical protein
MRNEELRRRSGIEDAAKAAKRLKWRWGGPGKMDIRHDVLGPRIGRKNR